MAELERVRALIGVARTSLALEQTYFVESEKDACNTYHTPTPLPRHLVVIEIVAGPAALEDEDSHE